MQVKFYLYMEVSLSRYMAEKVSTNMETVLSMH